MGAPRITGKAGENGQHAGAGRHPGQDRRLPSVVTHPKPQRASARSWVGPGQPGSGVAIDWVTGWSCSSAVTAKRRLDVQSGLRKGEGDGITLPARA